MAGVHLISQKQGLMVSAVPDGKGSTANNIRRKGIELHKQLGHCESLLCPRGLCANTVVL